MSADAVQDYMDMRDRQVKSITATVIIAFLLIIGIAILFVIVGG